MLSTDVDLPRDYVAKFPDHCVGCREETFRETYRISTRDFRLGSILFWWMLGSKAVVEFPCCQTCKFKMRMQRFGSAIATLFLAIIAIYFFFPILKDWERPLGRIMMLVMGLVCVSPVVIFQVFFPPAFDITSSKKSISYEFKHEEDAIAFSELNEDAEWMTIS
jgi:fatty acid desaturase